MLELIWAEEHLNIDLSPENLYPEKHISVLNVLIEKENAWNSKSSMKTITIKIFLFRYILSSWLT